MIKLKERVFFYMKTEIDMKEISEMEKNMDMEYITVIMDLFTEDPMIMMKRMEKDFYKKRINQYMMDNFKMIKEMGMVYKIGLMVNIIKENG